MRLFNYTVSRAAPKHSLDFETPLTEDFQTNKNTEKGVVGGPKIRRKKKHGSCAFTRHLHFSLSFLALVLARKIGPLPTNEHSNNPMAAIGSQFTYHQGWIPLPVPVPDSVVHQVMHRG